ncbi:MAG: paraquat-inducible protein A [Pseudomonadota bacterium]
MTNRRATIQALNERYVACQSCDALWPRPQLEPGQRARCPRCHSVVLANKTRGVERTTALMLASLVVYIVAIAFPFMSMERAGLSNEISVIDAVTILWSNGMGVLAITTGLLILLFPLTRVVMILVLHAVVHRRLGKPAHHAFLLRIGQMIEPWAMADIFMIGVIVSLVKVGSLARIEVGPAFWAMSALIVFMAMGTSATCRDTVWDMLRQRL